jgi:hypothetical protein
MSEKKLFGQKKQAVRSDRTHDHFWVKNPYKNSACQNKKNEGGRVKFLNGYSLIYFVLYVFAQPRLGNILYKVIILKGENRSCKPQNVMVGTSKLENNIFLTMQD